MNRQLFITVIKYTVWTKHTYSLAEQKQTIQEKLIENANGNDNILSGTNTELIRLIIPNESDVDIKKEIKSFVLVSKETVIKPFFMLTANSD